MSRPDNRGKANRDTVNQESTVVMKWLVSRLSILERYLLYLPIRSVRDSSIVSRKVRMSNQ